MVGIIGPRQCGKTTLAKMYADERPDDFAYLDLELPSDLARLSEPELYLKSLKDRLIIIDEIQRKPDLFPLIRSLVDAAGARPGQFMILGSASVDLLKQSSESLAGRIVYHELTPFHLGEADGQSLWIRGGFPKSFLARSDRSSFAWREAFVLSYLERDLPQLGFRTQSVQTRRFLEMVCHCHGQLWNGNKIAASLGVSAPTVRRYLDMLEETFVVRSLSPYHANLKKRLVKSPKVYLRDSGLFHTIMRIRNEETLLASPHAGASFEGWVIEQFFAMLPESWQIDFYRTNAGAEIDLVVFPPARPPIGVEIKLSLSPSLGKGFANAFEDLGCEKGFVIYPGMERYPMSDTVEAVPVSNLPRLIEEIVCS